MKQLTVVFDYESIDDLQEAISGLWDAVQLGCPLDFEYTDKDDDKKEVVLYRRTCTPKRVN
jgi:hypothetical protein